MTQEAYDEVMLGMVMMNLKRLFGKRDAIYSKDRLCRMLMTGKHLSIRLLNDVAISIPYRDILTVDMSYSAERDYGLVIITTKAYYSYSIRLDKDELDSDELVK